MAIRFAFLKVASGPLGYLAVGGLVGMESLGIPVPGETALIAAGVLAHHHQLQIVLVIACAAAGAIIGDNIGYLIGRTGGRALLERKGPFETRRKDLLRKGEPFFNRYGPRAVFFGRWISGLRIAAAWLAGISRMRWPLFLFWNALGGVAWATSVGLLSYFLGATVEQILKTVGIVGVGLVVILIAGVVVFRRRRAKT